MKKIRSNGVLLLTSSLLCGVVAEVLARWLLPPMQSVKVEQTVGLTARHRAENARPYRLDIADHPEQARGFLYIWTAMGRRLRANTVATIDNHSLSQRRIEVKTNSIGYRNPEIGTKGGKRILFLGDSITFADYLAEDSTFVRLVEKQAREDGLNWETINAGVGAISLKNELAILMETGLDLEPDIVVVGFYLNDFRESPGVYIQPMPAAFEYSRFLYYLLRGVYVTRTDRLPRDSHGEEEWNTRLGEMYELTSREERERISRWRDEFEQSLGGERDEFHLRILESFSDWGGAWSPDMWNFVQPLLAEFAQLGRERGFAPVVVAFPVRQQVEAAGSALYDYPQQRLLELANELDIPLLDMLPVLRNGWHENQRSLFFDHCHHTPEGSKIIAEYIYRFLASRH